jgi:hypothetical protein
MTNSRHAAGNEPLWIQDAGAVPPGAPEPIAKPPTHSVLLLASVGYITSCQVDADDSTQLLGGRL